MNTPILIIGPTSSGKTALSLWLAQKLGNTDILVVDSKQVYRGQDITTGKDLPVNFQFSKTILRLPCFTWRAQDDNDIRLFGIDLVEPNEQWSVAQFLEYAKEIIEQATTHNRQLIIVGGTPQFTLSLFDRPETVSVTPNPELRKELEKLSLEKLQEKVDPERLAHMNNSDRNNPRRLIRAIEVGKGKREKGKGKDQPPVEKKNAIWIGLEVKKEDLEKRIRKRVIARIEHGAIEEYEKLKTAYPDWTPEAKAAIGYSEIEKYVSRELSEEELINLWTLHEVQYAKRQMQWWKRETHIQWFDALHPDLHELVFQRVKS